MHVPTASSCGFAWQLVLCVLLSARTCSCACIASCSRLATALYRFLVCLSLHVCLRLCLNVCLCLSAVYVYANNVSTVVRKDPAFCSPIFRCTGKPSVCEAEATQC